MRKYKGQTTRAERLVELNWAKREDTAMYHLPPCCCMRTGRRFGGPNMEKGAEFLHACKLGVDQYVSLQVC